MTSLFTMCNSSYKPFSVNKHAVITNKILWTKIMLFFHSNQKTSAGIAIVDDLATTVL